MKIHRLDHFTLRTALLTQTTRFYEQVAGLSVGWRPPFPFDGCWLYSGDHPILHLIGARASSPPLPAIDHIAFRCDDLPSFETKLRRLGIEYHGCTVPLLREHQVFVSDPNGQVIEFIFDAIEQASW